MRTTTVTDTTCPNCGTFTPKDTEPHWDSNDCIAALRTELDAAQTRCDEHERDAGYWHYRALRTEAELAALQAAQQWRPVTEKPAEPPDGETSEYLTWNELVGFTVRCYRDGQFHSAFRNQPTHYRPLPPAPDEADEVQP